MMFCVDSCSVFRDILIYLAENRDIANETEPTDDQPVPVVSEVNNWNITMLCCARCINPLR